MTFFWLSLFLFREGTIEVPRVLLSEFQNLPSTVTVEVLPSIHRCTSVDVEPVSVKDWELLEVYAQELEMGGLLQQVSVVYPNQLLRLCLGRDMAHVVVKSSSVNQESSVWSTAEATSEPCVLLIETTEFIVTPKPRPSESPMEWSSPLRLIPCIDDWNKSMFQMAKLSGTSPLLVPPGCILVNKASWSSKREWAKVASYPPVEDQNQLLRVLVSPLVPEQQAGRLITLQFLDFAFVSVMKTRYRNLWSDDFCFSNWYSWERESHLMIQYAFEFSALIVLFFSCRYVDSGKSIRKIQSSSMKIETYHANSEYREEHYCSTSNWFWEVRLLHIFFLFPCMKPSDSSLFFYVWSQHCIRGFVSS